MALLSFLYRIGSRSWVLVSGSFVFWFSLSFSLGVFLSRTFLPEFSFKFSIFFFALFRFQIFSWSFSCLFFSPSFYLSVFLLEFFFFRFSSMGYCFSSLVGGRQRDSEHLMRVVSFLLSRGDFMTFLKLCLCFFCSSVMYEHCSLVIGLWYSSNVTYVYSL